MPTERRFEVIYACAGQEPGAQVGESDLEGVNVDALVEGGFLREIGGSAPTPASSPTPPVSSSKATTEGAA